MSHLKFTSKTGLMWATVSVWCNGFFPRGLPPASVLLFLIKPNQLSGSSAGTAKNGTSCPAVTMEVMQMIMIPVSVN